MTTNYGRTCAPATIGHRDVPVHRHRGVDAVCGKSGPTRCGAALVEHDAIVRAAIEAHEGYVFSTGGDGFGAAFGRAAEAVDAARAAQEALAGHPILRVRMGINTGEVHERDGDYFGPPVNRTARLMAAGHGGQVLVSAVTAELVPGLMLKNLGEHRLRDLGTPMLVWQLGTDDFPPLRTLDELPGNLPVQRTSFVGRVDEVKELAALVRSERLVTLTGPGGVGKSRLALAGRGRARPGLSRRRVVRVARVARRGRAGGGDDSRSVGRARAARRAGARHVVWVGASAVRRWWSSTTANISPRKSPQRSTRYWKRPRRWRSWRRVRRRSGCAVSTCGRLRHCLPATVVARQCRVVRRSGPHGPRRFRAHAENEAAVVEICDRLDHVPLAIELAAARVRGMTPADIARRLDQRLRLLASTDRSAPGRHRTLDAAVRWSYELCDDTQRQVFDRLSVFAGPFTIDAAEAVVGGDGVEEWEVLDAVLALVDKSLVVADENDDEHAVSAVGDDAPVRPGQPRGSGNEPALTATATPTTTATSCCRAGRNSTAKGIPRRPRQSSANSRTSVSRCATRPTTSRRPGSKTS